MSRRSLNGLRWAIPLLLTGLLAFLLAHTSRDGEVLARYSRQYTRLLISTLLLVAVVWWIAADRARFVRVVSRALRPATLLLLAGALAFLALLDIFVDLRLLLSLLPAAVALGMLWLTAPAGSQQADRLCAAAVPRNLALVAIALLAGLALSEAVFRGVLVERLVPNTDRQFYRAVVQSWPHPVAIEVAPGVQRILGLADSFGQAGGAQNYYFVLEDLLNQAGQVVETVNFAVSGYEPIDELALLRGYGPRYRPELVIHGFFVGNDFNQPVHPLMMSQGVQFRPESSGLWSLRPRNFWLLEWLPHFAVAIGDRWQKQGTARHTTGPSTATDASDGSPAAVVDGAAAGTVSEDAYLRVEHERLNLMRVGAATETQWQATLDVLDEIRSLAQRMGSDYVLVIHPDQLQVEEPLFRQLVAFYGLDPAKYDLELPQKFLLDYCAENGIRCIDLLPAFRAQGAQGGLYLPRDTHYNAAGNRLAAEQIFEALSRQNPHD